MRLINTTDAETWRFSSEGVFMYPLAKVLNTPLRSIGVTPNMITIFNIFVGFAACYLLATERWLLVIPFIYAHQLLDAMDGSMARTYGLGTSLGAKLDEYTDITFGIVLAVSAMCCGWPNLLAIVFIVVFGLLLLCGELSYKSAEEMRKPLYVEELNLLEFIGLWGIENMTYNMTGIGLTLYWFKTTTVTVGWMKSVVQFMAAYGVSLPVIAVPLVAFSGVMVFVVKSNDAKASTAAMECEAADSFAIGRCNIATDVTEEVQMASTVGADSDLQVI